MKKVLLVGALLLATSSAIACDTRVYIVDGKAVVCTICPYYTVCN